MSLTTKGNGQSAHILVTDDTGKWLATVKADSVEEVIRQLSASANRGNPTQEEWKP